MTYIALQFDKIKGMAWEETTESCLKKKKFTYKLVNFVFTAVIVIIFVPKNQYLINIEN